MDIIETRELTKKFNSLVAVDHISFSVQEGEVFGFLGPNGAGKTTTINILTTLLRPTEGSASVAGLDVVKEPDSVRKAVGLVPQDLTVDEDLTGMENMVLQAKLYHVPDNVARTRIRELMELVELTDASNRKVETYSGGMRKRLELASGLIHYPKVLFLDEPTLGLDVQTRTVMWNYIRKLKTEQKMTVFLTTHYMEEADGLCDRIGIIDHGKIKALDSPSSLKDGLGGDVIQLQVDGGALDLTQELRSVPLVNEVKRGSDAYRMKVVRGEEALPAIIEKIVKMNLKVNRVELVKPTLDDVYLEYTGRSLREEQGSWEETWRTMRNIRRIRA